MFWDFVGKVGIQNIFARTRYQVVLQSNHFAGNTKQDKNKGYKIRIIGHLNELLQAVFPSKCEQSIDEHMTEFQEFLFLVLTSSSFTTIAWMV